MNWQELANAELDKVLAWAAERPWAQAMADCAQDAGWHAEGDVWTHTQLVCAQLPRLEAWPTLNRHEQNLLVWTALFHDAAKPLTSQVDPETGRIRSPKHAVHGERLARAELRGLGCDLATREQIARLVRYHGRPAFVLDKPQPALEAVRLSWLADNRLLYLFALADNRGRTTVDSGRPEENLHLFRVAAEEQGCFDRPYPFAHDHARLTFFRQPEPDLHYVPHESYRCAVTVMCGVPGAGKDTWLAEHRPGLPCVALDDIRAELEVEPTDDQGAVAQRARERCRELLRAGTSFAFNATNILRVTRGRWIDLFCDYGARIELVYLEPALERILGQNGRRERNVPERVIRELLDKVEPPTWTEGHQVEFVASEG